APARLRHAREPDVAGGPRVEDDEPDDEPLLLVLRVATGIVELVEDGGADPPCTPLAVVRLGGVRCLEGDVVRMDLRADAVEEDAPLAAYIARRGCTPAEQAFCDRLHDRPAELVAHLVAVVGNLERRGEDGLGTLVGEAR